MKDLDPAHLQNPSNPPSSPAASRRQASPAQPLDRTGSGGRTARGEPRAAVAARCAVPTDSPLPSLAGTATKAMLRTSGFVSTAQRSNSRHLSTGQRDGSGMTAPTAEKLILVGSSGQSKACNLWNPAANEVLERHGVTNQQKHGSTTRSETRGECRHGARAQVWRQPPALRCAGRSRGARPGRIPVALRGHAETTVQPCAQLGLLTPPDLDVTSPARHRPWARVPRGRKSGNGI
ncbi:MAG: hypothetical protein BJ554DRAFT_2151 [Olpidium bornovanus]|uniref:Uncharacterized protein n=1 Tax=Olpidium bornovanus TaxID=278681 RepID=A0A8H7ZRC2_9FUNG|nr:MAG: hypothetical protein BJ554DRAFT_2151 [Olpidium bornovanus]